MADGQHTGTGMDRRGFFRIVGVSGAAAAAAGCGKTTETLLPYVIPPEHIVPGVATWFATVCRECSAGCGVLAKSREGRIVKLEGNPDHPVNRGALCATGQASLLSTYDPDRIGLMIIDGRLADARRELEAYTQKTPDDEDGWLMLGDVYRALGDDARARVTDARAAQIAPDYVGLRRPSLKGSAASNHGSTPTTGTGDLVVDRVYMARNYPAAAADITTNFAANDRVIHCIAELNQAQAGTLVRFVWKTVSVGSSQNEAFKTVDYTTKAGESRVHGNLSLPNDWPRGTYKVEIYINNALAKSVNYSIQ